MVQKKVPNKLGNLQADHIKSHKLLVNFKPSSFLHQESKNRGSDKKMIMKKYQENFRNHVPQPGKPPPPPISPSKMQSLTKTSDKKPNYMKPTSSSDARKENSQTSKKNGKSPSSEKLVRTLTKTTSFKPARTASANKICRPESFDVQRATCSSTLKDSKFPDYLTLNSRGTESEGTSIIKVCPYIYCSLNGHHHLPLPPLKSFLSAKRRMMKTQRSLKLGCISRSKMDAMEEIELLQLSFQEKLADEESHFFIQIFSNEREAGDRDETEEVLESPLPEINYQETYQCHGNSNFISSDTDAADYSSEENPNENAVDEFMGSEITTMEVLWKKDDEVSNTSNIMADDEAFGASDSELEMEGYPTLYLEESITTPDEIERNYFEELKLEEMVSESIEKKNIMGSDANCDQDFKIDNMQKDDEIDDLAQKVDIFMYDDGIAVEDMSPRYYIENNEEVFEEEEMEEANTIGNHFPPSDQILESSCVENLNDLEESDATKASMIECSDSQTKSDAGVQVSTDIVEESFPESEAESDARVQVSADIGEESCPESDARVQVSMDIGEESCPESDTRVQVSTDIGEESCPESDAQVQVSTDIGEESCPESDTRVQVSTDIGEESCPESDAQVQVSTDIGEESCPESDTLVQVSTDIGEESCCPESDKSKRTIDTGDAIEKRIFDLDVDKNSKKGKWIYDRKESMLEQNESKEFNPRGPNFLQLESGPEAEKVDLKHQIIDDRRNSEEWMLDYALQQAVTKLAAARKKKVTLLVEAFETVSPLPKWENKLRRHPSAGFDHPQRIQACG